MLLSGGGWSGALVWKQSDFRGDRLPLARQCLMCLLLHPGGAPTSGPSASDPWAPAFSDPWGGSPAKPSTNGTTGTGWALSHGG